MSRRRVLVVRSGDRPFASGRKRSSIEIVEKVSHSIEPVRKGAESLGRPAELAIFTSQVAVERLLEEKDLAAIFRKAISGGRVAAVGPATAQALSATGFPPAIVARGSVRNLLSLLPKRMKGWRVILPQGEDAGAELPEELERRGAILCRLILYRKIAKPPDRRLAREIVEHPFDAFCATSPSAARWLFDGANRGALTTLRQIPAVALGPSTRRELEAQGIRSIEEPQPTTFGAARRLLERLAAGKLRA